MRFGRSAPALLIAMSVAIVVTITIISQVLNARLLSQTHESEYQLMRQVVANSLKSAEERAVSRAELAESIPAVHDAFLARDREKLLAQGQKMFKEQEEKYGLDQAQFHLPPGVSFLRLHKPSEFGDEQASYRPMLAAVHNTHAVQKGVAITKMGPAVFGIIPVTDDSGKFVGSFEMGLEFAPTLDRIKEAYGMEAMVYFDEKLLREMATGLSGDVLSPKNRVGKYVRFHATHPELAAALITDRDVDITEPRRFERTAAGSAWGVQLIPLYNYTKKQIGVIAVASDFAEEKTAARHVMVLQVLAAVVAIVLMAGVILIVIRGVVLAPLGALAERMSALANGDEAPPADPMDIYCEELQTFAASYEKLRASRES